MLSLDFIRQNKLKVIKSAKNKNREVDIEKLLRLDDERKNIIFEVQTLREKRNALSKNKGAEKNREEGKVLKSKISELEKTLSKIENEHNTLLLQVPNVYFDDVPVGNSKGENKKVREWGTVTKFPFPARSHIELGEELDLIDLKKGSKVSGFRGYFLKNQGAVLQFALLWYVFQHMINKGYTPIIPPSIVKAFSLTGTGQFPWGEREVYKLNDEDAYLAGTSEVSMMAYFANDIFSESDLPKKYVALSPCFRREAGSYGKDTKGLYRVHEFWKIEQIILCNNNIKQAQQLHSELQSNCEEVFQSLNLPFRVMMMCTGEMGEPQMVKYDTEVWMPSRDDWGEVTSNSIMGDFQCRRLNIKYRKDNGDKKYCFSLNNTAIASPRILIALLENHQQEDGSVAIPEILHKYTGFDKILNLKK